LNSLFGISKELCLHYDIGYNNGPLAILCHVVYATVGRIQNKAIAFGSAGKYKIANYGFKDTGPESSREQR
jgi:hypothetical protein